MSRFAARREFTIALMERRRRERAEQQAASFNAEVDRFVRRHAEARRLLDEQRDRETAVFDAAAALEARKQAFTRQLLEERRSDATQR